MMMNDDKELLSVQQLGEASELESSLVEENIVSVGNTSCPLSSHIITDISSNTPHQDIITTEHVGSIESPDIITLSSETVTTDHNVDSNVTVLLNRDLRTHVASDVNLGSLGDLSDSLAVTDSNMDNQLKVDDGALVNTSTTLLPENLVLFETSKGLVLSVANLDGLNFTSSFVSAGGDNRGQTVITSSLPGTIFPQIQLVSAADDTSAGVYETVSDGSLLIPSVIFPDGESPTENTQHVEQIQQYNVEIAAETIIEKPKKKGAGGWPKGKKRKFPPIVNTPKKPMTGYVIFAVKRRHELKVSNPLLSFPEVTKLLGQEWSDLHNVEKEKYLQQAEEDKQRYISEMKAFQNSEQYLTYVKNKQKAGTTLNGMASHSDKPLIDLEDVGNELYCKVCNKYFISAHNKTEHMYGSQHLENITKEIRTDIEQQKQQQLQQQLLDQYNTEPSSAILSLTGNDMRESDTLDISQFIQQFLGKNTDREYEIKSLRKTKRSVEEDNLAMSKRIKELEEYESKLEQDLGSLKAYGASLSAQVDVLKMVPTLFGVINF